MNALVPPPMGLGRPSRQSIQYRLGTLWSDRYQEENRSRKIIKLIPFFLY